MDVRGIEVTNQLRSAIRAKLLELGVRYDEELPDYILVMVVNKKTRQQMHEDLHLFLEDSTTPFVEWLHDQVLKKLQKVTIAKKKTTREFVPTVVVKQEEERRKRKTALLEDGSGSSIGGKVPSLVAKEEKPLSKIADKTCIEKSSPEITETNSTTPPSSAITDVDNILQTKPTEPEKETEKTPTRSSPIAEKTTETLSKLKTVVETRVKRTFEDASKEVETRTSDKRMKTRSVDSTDPIEEEEEVDAGEQEEEEENITRDDKRLKSYVNKPKVTSVVSVKNRLGSVSPRKKFETHRSRELENRHRQSDRRFDKTSSHTNRFDPINRRAIPQSGKNFEDNGNPSWNRSNESRDRQNSRMSDGRNRLGNDSRDTGRFGKNLDTSEKIARLKNAADKQVSTVKDRLGVNKNIVTSKQSIPDKPASRSGQNTIKNRLGPFRNNVRSVRSHIGFVPVKKNAAREADDDTIEAEDDQDDDQSVINVGPVKSHVIALKRPEPTDRRSGKTTVVDKTDASMNEEDDGNETKSIASKVIVTPRPLKPLQPAQKRATQSLLLRAVAEANQSVVKQKNPEPVISETKPKLKLPKIPASRGIGKNLSVHLNASKRLVMEKIQVQLRTSEPESNVDNGAEQHTPNPVNDEHMGVVMSLFQRSDDNQKFLVTLNGYNNNVVKEKNNSEEEDERLEMEVTEDDELVLSNVQQIVSYEHDESSSTSPQLIDTEDIEISDKLTYENNENHNSENVEKPEEAPQRKRRKLSPIVYNRVGSTSPSERRKKLPVVPARAKEIADRVPLNEATLSTVTDKSRDKCRYWPNCTLGGKCAYYHPAVHCSAFPGCKFGDKCAYKHPKCKFGLSCTKLGCVFSHPKQQCKYHPFCTKPTCPYSHPSALPAVPTEVVRAKFTWKRRD